VRGNAQNTDDMSEGTPPSQSGSGPVAPVATLPLQDDAAQQAVPSLGSVIADKYRIEELIARGGMGAVYMATHLVSGKKVALKWMLPALGQVPGAKDRFTREACATARIDHPNVIDIYDVGSDRGSVYLVMELLRGETLAEYLQRTPQVTAADAVGLLMPALRGVAAAHSHAVIHRDLKPDNIFLCRSVEGEPREPRVLDFGISKVGSGDDARLSLTRSGAVMGTPYYMSPEQVRGAKEVDERSDIYAFGVILYEMLTGQRPFEAETYNQLILKIATEDPAPILELNPFIDRRLVSVIERAMARDPHQRYPSIEELALALEPFANGVLFRASTARLQVAAANSGEHGSLRSSSMYPISEPPPPPRRSRAFMVLGIALGGVGAGLGFWALSYQRSHPEDRAPSTIAMPSVQPQAAPGMPQRETDVSASTRPFAAPALQIPNGAGEPAAPEPDVGANAAKPAPPSERRPRPRAHSVEAKSPAPAAAKANGKLPDDWDERLSIPTHPPASATMPAGPIDARDLR
jgi:serine/threonine protein kinase